MCDGTTKQFIKDTVENNTNRIKYDILRVFGSLRKDVEHIEDTVTHIDKIMEEQAKKVRDLEEAHRSRELNCPYAPAIKELMENLLTTNALKEYMNEQEDRMLAQQQVKDTKMRWVVGLISVGFTIITILVNLFIFYFEN